MKREEAAIALAKIMLLDNETPDLSVLDKYSDRHDISDTAVDFVALAIKNNVMQGNDENRFLPQESLSRAEACVLISRAKEIKNQQDKMKEAELAQKDPSDNIYGNSHANILNYGFAVKAGEYTYVASTGAIHKIKDGTVNPILVLNLNNVNFLNSYDGRIFYSPGYYGIACMDPDSLSVEMLYDEHCLMHQIIDGWIYFIQSDGESHDLKLHKIKTDGTNKTRISNDVTLTFDDYIYYRDTTTDLTREDYPTTWAVYRVKTDGTQKSLIAQYTESL